MVVALELSDKKRRSSRLWKCRCDCGKIFYTEAYKIHGQRIKSCGCLRNAHQLKDLTGLRFGKLTAIERLNEKRGKNSSYLWLCRCDCGNEIKANTNALLHGHYTSCGCGKAERLKAQYKQIEEQRFGKLTAIEPTEERLGGTVVWRCLCDCGNEVTVSLSSLISGNTKSCGCLHKSKPGPQKYMRYIDGTCIEMLETKKLRSDNTSGYTGVQERKKNGKWVATISFRGKAYHLGTYDKIDDAIKARQKAEEELFGSFLEWYYSVHGRQQN